MNIKLDIPESFYAGEEKCGYYVSPEMKKVWAVELDLIVEFARVCEKYGLKWWIDAGTLLGAVRHKGFIPWDDDVDILMMRRDYEKLLDVADNDFSHPYHLKSPRNDLDSLLCFAKLQNEDTAMFESREIMLIRRGKNLNYSQGIFIDIFPLDDIPDDPQNLMQIYKRAKSYKRIADLLYSTAYNYIPAYTKWKRPFKAALHLIVKSTNIGAQYKKYFVKYLDSIALCDFPGSKYIANMDAVSRKDFLENFLLQRSYFDETIQLPFEMLTLPAASCYSAILDQYYGDWHKYDITHSHGKFFDVDKSYKYYVAHGLPESLKI